MQEKGPTLVATLLEMLGSAVISLESRPTDRKSANGRPFRPERFVVRQLGKRLELWHRDDPEYGWVKKRVEEHLMYFAERDRDWKGMLGHAEAALVLSPPGSAAYFLNVHGVIKSLCALGQTARARRVAATIECEDLEGDGHFLMALDRGKAWRGRPDVSFRKWLSEICGRIEVPTSDRAGKQRTTQYLLQAAVKKLDAMRRANPRFILLKPGKRSARKSRKKESRG